MFEKEPNNNWVKDAYVNGTNKMAEALNVITEEELSNPERNFWNEQNREKLKSISELQTKLGIEADGNIELGTLGALKTWQENNNEVVRGIVTRKLIDSIPNNV